MTIADCLLDILAVMWCLGNYGMAYLWVKESQTVIEYVVSACLLIPAATLFGLVPLIGILTS